MVHVLYCLAKKRSEQWMEGCMHIVEQDLHFLGSNLKGQIRYKTTLHNLVKRCIS